MINIAFVPNRFERDSHLRDPFVRIIFCFGFPLAVPIPVNQVTAAHCSVTNGTGSIGTKCKSCCLIIERVEKNQEVIIVAKGKIPP